MSGFLLLIPFFLIRFGLLSALNANAMRRAAYFAPFKDNEKPAYWIYQISNAAILISLLFLKIHKTSFLVFCAGIGIYGIGTITLIISVIHFAAPAENGMNKTGLYRISRNPMYVAYFLYFMGCALLTQSLSLLGFVLAFQISAHWVILAEERWCIQNFGNEYRTYKNTVRRYIGRESS